MCPDCITPRHSGFVIVQTTLMRLKNLDFHKNTEGVLVCYKLKGAKTTKAHPC